MNEGAASNGDVQLYQVCFMEWSAPLMIVADDLTEAIAVATEHRAGKGHNRPVAVWEATAEWRKLSSEMLAHCEQVLSNGRARVVCYIEGEGWHDVMRP